MNKIAYYGSRISGSIFKTPEGYLICRDVPIARIGVQDYLGRELGENDNAEDVYKVTRLEKEVFDKAAVASFEGKPVCDDHPSEDVTAENYSQYMRGVVRDVREGQGEYKGCLVADLVIHDASLVQAIQDGKREISCGYNCLWVPTGRRTYEQREIRGNHVAVVDKGRAGHTVAIHDAAPVKKGGRNMKESILKRMFAKFITDADPDEALEAAEAVKKAECGEAKDEKDPVPQDPPADPHEARFKSIEDKLYALTGLLSKQTEAKEEKDPKEDEPDALDALEEELKAPADDEGDVEVDPQVINKAQSKAEAEGLVEADKTEEDPQAVRDSALALIKNLRPVLAQIPSETQRRNASDALANLIRGQVHDSGYTHLLHAATVGRSTTKDSMMDDAEYGRMIRDKFNPHYRK